jgi:hypothetical protein
VKIAYRRSVARDWLVLETRVSCTFPREELTQERITNWGAGAAVLSTFWPYWHSSEMTAATRRDIPGETRDGYAREFACMPAHFFTRAPRGYSIDQWLIFCSRARKLIVKAVGLGFSCKVFREVWIFG